MNLTAANLRAEIASGPLTAELQPMLAARNDAGIHVTLTRADRACRKPMDIRTLSSVCIGLGVTGTVQAMLEIPIGGEIAPGTLMTLPIKAGLYTVITLIQVDFRLETADADIASFQQGIGMLRSLGVIDEAGAAMLHSLGDAVQSRASELGWTLDVDLVSRLLNEVQ